MQALTHLASYPGPSQKEGPGYEAITHLDSDFNYSKAIVSMRIRCRDK